MIPVAKQCRLHYNSEGESVKLIDRARIKLEQFYLAFIVLFIGYSVPLFHQGEIDSLVY